MSSIRVILADDHPVFRFGLRHLINREDDLEVIAEADNGKQAVELVEAEQPDVLLLDISMPDMNGVEVVRHLRNQNLRTRIIVLSGYAYKMQVAEMIAHGAAGYLLKSEDVGQVVDAIRSVASGEEGWLSRQVAALLMKAQRQGGNPDPHTQPWTRFSRREQEVFMLLARGYTNREIGEALFISESTVKKHVNSIFEKTGLKTRSAAVAWAWENDLVNRKLN